MKIAWFALTHNGLVRSSNEDCVLCDGWIRSQPMAEPLSFVCSTDLPGVRVFAVADGLGGHLSGNVASNFALSRLCSGISDLKSVSESSLAEVVQDVHRALFEISRADSSYREMGATVAGMVLEPSGAIHVFHVGDSRVYRRVDRFLQLLTKDDRPGEIAFGESDTSGRTGSSLLQCLGGLREFLQIAPHITRIDVSEIPETFLLCTDGVSDVISQDEIEEAMSGPTGDAARRLFDKVRSAGAKDNVSIVIVEVASKARATNPSTISQVASGPSGANV